MSKHALHIKAGSHVKWSVDMKGIKPKRNYLLTLWVKREGWKDGEYPYLKIFGRDIRMNELSSWKAWRKVSYVLKAGPQSKNTLQIHGRGLSHGVSFDNVEIRELVFKSLTPVDGQETGGGKPLFSWKFPPSDLVFRMVLSLFKEPLFRFPKPSERVEYEMMNSQGTGLQILQKLPAGQWHWRIRAFLGAEEVTRSEIKGFTVKADSGKHLSYSLKSKRLYASAQPSSFFPIAIFNAIPKNFKELKKAGFNSIQSYIRNPEKSQIVLNEAANTGLRALIMLPITKDTNLARSFVQRAGASTTLLGWYLADEPEGHGKAPRIIRRQSDAIHALAPAQPTTLALLRSRMARYYGPAVDILLLDPYPIPTQPITWISDSIDEALRALGQDSIVWSIIQAFSWGNEPFYPKDKLGRFPTFFELRGMTYLAIVHGSRGIFFFNEPLAREDAHHWNNVKKLAGELRCLYPLLSSREKTQQARVANRDLPAKRESAIHFLFKSLTRKNRHATPVGCPALPKGRYLIAINATSKQAKIRLHSLGAKEKVATEIFSGEKIKLQNEGASQSFKPYGVRVWKLK